MTDDLPPIGLGTAGLHGVDCERAVETALDLGYRHVDTAQMYENEAAVGTALAASDVPREEVFVASKVHHRGAPTPTHDEVVAAGRASLDRLDLDRLDLLYVHWPTGAYDPEETLSGFETLYEDGLVDHVGLCNCTPDLLEAARDALDVPLFAHQVEMHPLLHQSELLADAQRHDHYLVAYSPLAKGRVFDVPEIVEIAERRDVTPAQVSLAWLTGRENVGAIPRSGDPDHIRENLAAQSLTLTDEERARIDAIEVEERVIDPASAPWNV